MKKATFVVFSLALTVALMPLCAEHTKPFKMVLWGTGSIPIPDVDGQPASTGLCRGNSNFGKFECTTTGYILPAPPPVVDLDACPEGYKGRFTKIAQNHIIRFENGDVLWMLPVDPTQEPDASYVCLDLSFAPVRQVITWEFMGGSGRFEGAKGRATWNLKGDAVPLGDSRTMFAVHPGPFEGYITLKNKQGN